jgi:hypothetical protein
VALTTLVLTVWLWDQLPSIAIYGVELSAGIGGMLAFVRHFVFPASAVAGATLALKNRRLQLAGLLVSVPTIVNWAGVVAFTVAAMIYGF